MSTFQGIIMPECNVQLWYNKQRVKKNGNVTLYVQLIIGGEHDEIPLKQLQWPADKFDWATKSLKPRHPGDDELIKFNALFEREKAKYWSVIMKFLLQDRVFTLKDIYREINMFKSGNLFCVFMKQAIRDRQKTTVKKDMIKESTARIHKTSLGAFQDFLKDGDIPISSIDGDLLEKYADHLRKLLGDNTVWLRVQNIKSYLSYAFRHKGVVNKDYERFVISQTEHDPTWLNEREINALLDLYWDEELDIEDERNLRAFLFATFTGLRISDLSRWNKNWIQGDFISFTPIKMRKSTGIAKPLLIPIIPIARQFIEELTADTFQIPVEQMYNRGLKKLAGMVDINKNVTSHVARHTFATWLAIEGVPVLVISKLLGHKNIQTTMVYVHIAEEYLAREMLKMQKRFPKRVFSKKHSNAPILAKTPINVN